MKKFRMPIKFGPEDYGKMIGPDGTLVDPGSSGSGGSGSGGSGASGFTHAYATVNVAVPTVTTEVTASLNS